MDNLKNENEIENQTQSSLFDSKQIKATLMTQFPFGYVPRSKIDVATGGILHPKTMANRDTDRNQKYIGGIVKIGGKICYPIERIIEFIETETVSKI